MSDSLNFYYGSDHLTSGKALEIARGRLSGLLGSKALTAVSRSRRAVEKIVYDGVVTYGINTGFGPLCRTIISAEDTVKLQENILRSHSSGMGSPIDFEKSKLMLILKLHTLARGYSGSAPETLKRIQFQIDNDIIPSVPSQGSVGASGDLAPLAHLFLPLIGLGMVNYSGRLYPAAEVLSKLDLAPLKLGPKEGLALINGTQFMSSHGITAVERFHNCLDCADLIGAMTLESLLGSVKPFSKELHELRPYSGSRHVARRLRLLLNGSEMLESHKACSKVQDPYSLRCMPQVHGAARQAWLHLSETVETEINSVTDNPVILESGEAVSGGNFHGQPIALPMDYAAFAAAELGNISDRRIYLLLEGSDDGLPPLLMKNTGINSGFMIPQYTSASLVTENKTLCFPASCDSIPTSLGQEDHVSMGSISGRKLNTILENVEKILAVELLCAAQAFDFRRPMRSSPVLEECHHEVRECINHADDDRVFADDLNVALELIRSKKLTEAASRGALKADIPLFEGENHELFGLY
ncbi:MAG: histidine ammonia-lyase [Spirochaetales bacterium]|nr:histidine ammonia-lyase [Spirochaetales bacterium]